MAEGGPEDIVLDDQNGSFQNQSEEASTSKRSEAPGALAWKLCLRRELLRTSRQRKEGRGAS